MLLWHIYKHILEYCNSGTVGQLAFSSVANTPLMRSALVLCFTDSLISVVPGFSSVGYSV